MSTSLIAKVVGPVLLVRALSILIDPDHFSAMIAGLDREFHTARSTNRTPRVSGIPK